MHMTGTIINIIAILVGSGIGLLFGSRIPEKFKSTIVAGMGLFTVSMGMQMFFNSENQLIVLGALIVGTIIGEWLGIEDRLQDVGLKLEKRFSSDGDTGAGLRRGQHATHVPAGARRGGGRRAGDAAPGGQRLRLPG